MAEFNPRFQNQPEQFLGYSKGYNADDSLGTLFKNKGDLIAAEVGAADKIIKMGIDDEARTAVDPIKDATIHALETGQLADGGADGATGGGGGNVPPEVSGGLTRLENLSAAKASGRLNESHYWNLLDAEARRMRARHPGYRDYVDERISQLAGGNPANKMIQELYQEQKAGLTSAAKEYDYWEKKAIEKGQAPDIEARKRQGKPYSVSQLREKVAVFEAQEATMKVDREQMAAELQRGQIITSRVTKSADKEIGFKVNTMLKSGFGPYDELTSTLDKVKTGGITNTGDIDLISRQLGSLKVAVRENLTRTFTNMDPNTKIRYADHLDKKAMDDIIDKNMAPIAVIEDAINNKNYGLIGAIATNLEAKTQNDSLNVFNTSETARKILQYQKFYGAQAMPILLADSKSFKDISQNALFNDSIFKSFDPQAGKKADNGIANEVERLKQAGAKPEVFREHFKKHTSILSNPALAKSDPALYGQSAQWLFGPGADSLLSTKDENGKTISNFTDPYKVYANLTDPKVSQGIIASGNQEAIKNYTNWVSKNFATMMQPAAEDAKRIVLNSKFSNLEWDANNLQFRVIPTNAEYNRSIGDNIERTVMDPMTTKSVDQINNMLKGITSLITAQGGNAKEELPKYVEALKIPVGAKKQGTALENLWDTMWGKVKASEAEVSKPTSGSSTTAKPKAEESRVPPSPEYREGQVLTSKSDPGFKVEKRNGKWYQRFESKDGGVTYGLEVGPNGQVIQPNKSKAIDRVQ